MRNDRISVLMVGGSNGGGALASMNVAHASRVAEAVDRLDAEAFDAIVIDAAQLDADSPYDEAVRLVHEHAPQTPIVLLSGGDPPDSTGDGDGADEVLRTNRMDERGLGIALRFAIERAARRRAERQLADAHRELRVAWQIQQNLYPTRAPAVDGYDIAGASHPADAVGGDYFDYFPMLGERLGIAIGDASGHGIGPALLMAEARAALRSLAVTHADPGQVLTAANRVLSDGMLDKHFVTLMLTAFDPVNHTVEFASAGHPGGLVFDRHGRFRSELGSTGFPLGVMAGSVIPLSDPIQLEPGQMVVLFTDGITEASARRSDEAFGLPRLVQTVEELHPLASVEIVDTVYQRVLEHCRPRTPADDATIVVVKIDAA